MVNPISNPSYLLSPLSVLVVSFIMMTLLLLTTRRSRSTWLFSSLLLCVGLSGFFIFGMRSSPDIHLALPWDKAAIVTGLAIFLFYYHFTLAYTNTRGQRGILIGAYLFLVAIIALAPTDLLLERMRLEQYGYAPVLGFMGFLIMLGTLTLMVMGGYNLLRRYKASFSHEERNRILYLVIALLFPIVGGFLDGLTNLPPASMWGNLIFCIICSIAILRYHLLDIHIVIRKSLAYLLVSSMIAIPYVGILFLLNQILETITEPWWVHTLIILFLAILLRPLYSWSQKLIDRLFYRDRYDYLNALQRFSQ
ncbi:histidine kinase N-terminal 7TM domain-containing protein, partial [Chloroflexota bacterium]